MAAELLKKRVGLFLSKLAGAAAAFLPIRTIDSCARRTNDCSVLLPAGSLG